MNKRPDAGPEVLLTGATGRVGRLVARELAAAGVRFRAFVRSPGAATELGAADVVEGSFASADKLRRAMQGIATVLLISGDAPNQAELEGNVVRAAVDSGARRLIKLSAHSAGFEPPRSFGRHHRAVEDAIDATSLAWTFLRPTFFQQSLSLFAGTIRSGGNFVVPAGEAKVAFVDVRDVAAAMVTTLQEPGHERRTYTLTGPQALSFAEAASLLSARLGRRVAYVSPPIWLARLLLPLAAGIPRWLAREVVDLLQAMARGAQGNVTPDLETLLRKPARPLSAFFDEALPLFAGPRGST